MYSLNNRATQFNQAKKTLEAVQTVTSFLLGVTSTDLGYKEKMGLFVNEKVPDARSVISRVANMLLTTRTMKVDEQVLSDLNAEFQKKIPSILQAVEGYPLEKPELKTVIETLKKMFMDNLKLLGNFTQDWQKKPAMELEATQMAPVAVR